MSELKERMSYAEFVTHWVDYELCPWGDDWHQTDMIIRAQIGKPRSGADYIPRRRIPVTPQSQDELVAKVKGILGAFIVPPPSDQGVS